MKKLSCCALIALFAVSFFIGAANTQAYPPYWKGMGLIQCIWRCHVEKGELYNCCRHVSEGGGGKMECYLIGEC